MTTYRQARRALLHCIPPQPKPPPSRVILPEKRASPPPRRAARPPPPLSPRPRPLPPRPRPLLPHSSISESRQQSCDRPGCGTLCLPPAPARGRSHHLPPPKSPLAFLSLSPTLPYSPIPSPLPSRPPPTPPTPTPRIDGLQLAPSRLRQAIVFQDMGDLLACLRHALRDDAMEVPAGAREQAGRGGRSRRGDAGGCRGPGKGWEGEGDWGGGVRERGWWVGGAALQSVGETLQIAPPAHTPSHPPSLGARRPCAAGLSPTVPVGPADISQIRWWRGQQPRDGARFPPSLLFEGCAGLRSARARTSTNRRSGTGFKGRADRSGTGGRGGGSARVGGGGLSLSILSSSPSRLASLRRAPPAGAARQEPLLRVLRLRRHRRRSPGGPPCCAL